MPVPRYRYLTPTDAARASKLEIIARQVVKGLITGQHKSPHRGFSVEFSEHREYVAGDEIRHMDWRRTAAPIAITSSCTSRRPTCERRWCSIPALR